MTLPKADWIGSREASRRADVNLRTMVDWAGRYNLGRKIGGRWRIDPEALAGLLQGNPAPSIGGGAGHE